MAFPSEEIIKALQEQVMRAKSQLQQRNLQRDQKVQGLLALLFQDIAAAQIIAPINVQHKMDLAKAVGTLRKTHSFGFDSNGAARIDFEWPTKKQLLKMQDDPPIRLTEIEW